MAEKKSGTRGKRPPSAPSMRLRRILAENVQAMMDLAYPTQAPRGKAGQQKKFAKDAGVSWSSIQRLLDPEKGKTLDLIADVAAGLEVKIADLLTSKDSQGSAGPFVDLPTHPVKPPHLTALRKPRY